MKINNKGMIRAVTVDDDPCTTIQCNITYPKNYDDKMRVEGSGLANNALSREFDTQLIQYAVDHGTHVDKLPLDCLGIIAHGYALYHKMFGGDWATTAKVEQWPGDDYSYRGTINNIPIHENGNIPIDQNNLSPIIGVKDFHAYIGDVVETPIDERTINYSVTFKINSFDGWVEMADSEAPG